MSDRTDDHTGSDGSAETEQGAGQRTPVFPTLLISGLTAVVLMLCLYSVLSIFAPARLGVLADTVTTPAEPKPAWYFLFLYQYLREAPGVVAALMPVALLAVLGLWPFLDRNPSREPRKRVPALLLGALALVAFLALTYLGWTS
jgi:quinol-cytochrome oxidoreductase complex cytochrome b subunit